MKGPLTNKNGCNSNRRHNYNDWRYYLRINKNDNGVMDTDI